MHWIDQLVRAIEKTTGPIRIHIRVRDKTPRGRSRGGPVNGYNFTERVRRVLALAREESERLHHEYVGTEHILLGLIAEGEGVASAVLQNLSADGGAIRRRIEEVVKEGRASKKTGPELPYTSRAKKVLELAMSEARELNHSYVGTEHLLLGLLREQKGVAAQVLDEFGVELHRAREETLRLLGSEIGAAEAQRREAVGSRGAIPLRGVPSTPAASGVRPVWSAADAELKAAELRRLAAEAHRIEIETKWLRVRGTLELSERTGTAVRLEPGTGGDLWLVLGDDLARVRVPVSEPVPPAEPLRGEGGA